MINVKIGISKELGGRYRSNHDIEIFGKGLPANEIDFDPARHGSYFLQLQNPVAGDQHYMQAPLDIHSYHAFDYLRYSHAAFPGGVFAVISRQRMTLQLVRNPALR